jgi:hypothetical protein
LAGEYEVRFGKLGSTLIVTLVQRSTGTERQVVISGMDEMLVAAPRLVAELTKSTSAGVSPSVDNVTAPETRTSLHKATSAGFSMGLLGATAVGVDPGFSGGVSLHLGFRMGQAGVALDGRAGGIGSGDNKLVLTDVGVGGRYYITNADMTPFVAGGVALSYFGADRGNNPALSGSGLGAYAEIGFEGFRTSRTGFIASVRADFPFFSLNSSNDGLYYYNYTGTAVTPPPTVSTYVVPVTLDVGIVFN